MNNQQTLPPSPPIKKRNSFDLTLLENHHHLFLKIDTQPHSNSAPNIAVPMTTLLKSSSSFNSKEDDHDFLLYRPSNSSTTDSPSSTENSPSIPNLNFFPDLSSFS